MISEREEANEPAAIEQYIAGMLAMEEKYPNVGWKQNAQGLKKFWDAELARHEIGRRYIERIGREIKEPGEEG